MKKRRQMVREANQPLPVPRSRRAASSNETEAYLSTRAKRASRRKFEEALARIPDVEPEERDAL